MDASEDDLIVVDDVEGVPPPQFIPLVYASDSDTNQRPKTVAEHSIASTSRLRSSSRTPQAASVHESSERTTRSSTAKSKPQPKLKLKLSDKAAAQAPGMSFLGQYDRELDSDDEDLAFEEQFILRMPPGEDCEKLRKMVAAREVTNDVWFKFKGEDAVFLAFYALVNMRRRLASGYLSYWEFYIFFKTCGFTMYHRVAEDTGQ